MSKKSLLAALLVVVALFAAAVLLSDWIPVPDAVREIQVSIRTSA